MGLGDWVAFTACVAMCSSLPDAPIDLLFLMSLPPPTGAGGGAAVV